MKLLGCLTLVACGGAAAGLSLSASDNDPGRLQGALAQGHVAAAPAGALAFVVVPPELRAVDLTSGKTLWSVPADVRSRVVVGTSQVAAVEGNEVVARAVSDGHVLWKLPLAERLVGLAADGDRVIVAAGTTVASVVAGKERWRVPAPGEIGAPAAQSGIVYLPLQSQWLALLDGETGAVLARVRRNDQAIKGVRALPEGVTYGSRSVMRLSDGPEAQPLAAMLPQGVEIRWFSDGYDPIQANYSAFDRTRMLWRPASTGGFAGPVVALAFRALFAVDPATGALAWAHLVPRAEVVSAEHVGGAVLLATADGHLEALDPASGAVTADVRVGGRITGATFSAEGFRPVGAAKPTPLGDALAAIVRDKDPRLAAQKRLAIRELGRLGGGGALLVGLVTDAGTPSEIAEDAASVLLGKPDASAVPAALAALAVHNDRVKGTHARGVAILARLLAAAKTHEAVGPLLDHLEDPATPPAIAVEVGDALRQIGAAQAVARLVSVLLLQRCDPEAADVAGAALDAVFTLGGQTEQELIAFVADDPRTAPALAAHAREKLGR